MLPISSGDHGTRPGLMRPTRNDAGEVLFETTVKGVLGAEPPRKSVGSIGGVFFPKGSRQKTITDADD